MGREVNKRFYFNYRQKVSSGILMLILLFFGLFITSTIAYFFDSDFGTGVVGMSGGVYIEAVGKGDKNIGLDQSGNFDSIEDNATTNLIITLSDEYERLIPGMDVTIDANCKVFASTTSPLLRAKIEFQMYNQDDQTHEGATKVFTDMHDDLTSIIESNNWRIHTAEGEDEAYWYYVGDVVQKPNVSTGDLVLKEIDVTDGDDVISFIDEPIKFPSYVDSTYSGFGVVIKITFQAIQNFIPDKNGNRLSNTITNAQMIFKNTFTKIEPEDDD